MKRISQWTSLFILLFSILCIPVISEAITVTISKVDPLWKPQASTRSNLSVAWVDVTISGIDPRRDQYKKIVITLQNVTNKKGICCNSTAQDITDTGLATTYQTTKDLIFRSNENSTYWGNVSESKLEYQIPSDETQIQTTMTLPVGVFLSIMVHTVRCMRGL